jgi:thymidylate kinase/thymidylate synthase ThyX
MNEAGQEHGLFLAIEGTDGSGKGTQVQLLVEKLTQEGYDVQAFDFPRYDEPSSHFVREYLNGNYGSAGEVGPYTASLFYALDRYEAAPKIREALKDGKIVIANRFTGSNMAHQGTKFDNTAERKGYFLWLDAIEFQMLGIPRPDLSLVLRVPAEVAQKLVDQKDARSYTDKKRDLHEADLSHMKKSVEVYDNLCQLFPKDFKPLDCTRENQLLGKDVIANLIWKTVMPMLPPKDKKSAKSPKDQKVVKIDSKYLRQGTYGLEVTPAGHKLLEGIVTNTKDNVYSFYDGTSPITIAAAMARLSRRADDMRITLLDEFLGEAGKDDQLLKRVITAYGDDSVQQLVGQHVVVEGASNLLTKKLEWGRLAAYLEQSTRYIYLDKRDSNGKYPYYTPENFSAAVRKKYEATMDQIFDLYSDMVRKVTDHVQHHSNVPEKERDGPWKAATRAQACDAVRPVLPVAVKTTVGIFASGQALESLIMHLLSDDLPEARTTGEKLLREARKTVSTFLERADKPERGGAWIAYKNNTSKAVQKLSDSYLPSNHTSESEPVTLTNYWPKNELDLVADILYEHSAMPLESIRDEVSGWTYDKKVGVLEAFMGERLNRRHRPGRALENAHYSFDLFCDYGGFRDLQRHRMVDDMNWQQLTPRYGYAIPELVEEAGLSHVFEQCFDLSYELYSYLQEKGYALEAQYATLLGHRMRWKMTMNAREAFHLIELRTSPQGHPGYRKLSKQMHDKIAEVHPLLAGAMKFINKDEDPELTRLAAERYTQFKLDQLT